MPTATLKVLLNFVSRMSDDAAIPFATNISDRFYLVTSLGTPPLSQADLILSITELITAKANQPNTGKLGTAVKDQKRAALDANLRILAAFVQDKCGNDLAVLLSTGFEAASQNRASYPLSTPRITATVPGAERQALVSMTTESVSKGCNVSVAEVTEDGAIGVFSTPVYQRSSRKIPVNDLIPGKLYAVRGRLLGGSTEQSNWSEVAFYRAV
jgi:hypothetical protein